MFNQMSLSNVDTNNCPCKGCTKETGRSAGCHAVCERYIPWKENHDKKLEEKSRKREEAEIYYTGMTRRNKSLTTKSVNFRRKKK